MNINTWHGCGNLTRDPEVKFLPNNTAVCKLTIAINRTWKDAGGEKKQETTFVDCEAWGKTAEMIGQYCTKGSEMYVQGRLKLDTWEKDGQKHSKMKVVIENMQLGRKPGGGGDDAAPRPAAAGETIGADGLRRNAAAPTGAPQDDPPF